MTQLISGVYASHADAAAATAELESVGLEPRHIHTEAGGASPEALAADLASEGIKRSDADKYVAVIKDGASYVSVRPFFGESGRAIRIMQSYNPTELSLHVARDVGGVRADNPAPFSSVMGWRILSNTATPFSDRFGWQVLKNPELSDGLLSDKPAPFSSLFGLKLLSDSAAPFSRLFGLNTLSDQAAPFSTAIGKSTLTDEPAPFSKRMGWKTLSQSATPFSDLLGLKVLSDDQS
jgi:hypothetical protein